MAVVEPGKAEVVVLGVIGWVKAVFESWVGFLEQLLAVPWAPLCRGALGAAAVAWHSAAAAAGWQQTS